MKVRVSEIEERTSKLSDTDLYEMLSGNEDDYTPEALRVAEKELEKRGGSLIVKGESKVPERTQQEGKSPEGPKTFDVYVLEEHGERVGTAIKQGFCWPGLFFTYIWAFANRLWLLGTVLITSQIFFTFLAMTFLEEVDKPALGWLFFIIICGIAIFVGVNGNTLHGARREAEGFRKEMTVQGRNPADVLDRLRIPRAYAQAYSVSGVVAASIFTALALFFLILWVAVIIAGVSRLALFCSLDLLFFGILALILWVRSLRDPLSLPKGLVWGGGVFLLGVALAAYFMFASLRAESALKAKAAGGSVAVLPFVNVSSNPLEQQLADKMTKALISEIAKTGVEILPYASVKMLRDEITETVISEIADRDVKFSYHELCLPILNDADNMEQIMRDLGVDLILDGCVWPVGSKVNYRMQIIHVPSQTPIDTSRSGDGGVDLGPSSKLLARRVSKLVQE